VIHSRSVTLRRKTEQPGVIMSITRRDYLFAAGAASLQMAAASSARTAETAKAGGPVALLGKADFPSIASTTYVNNAANHPVPAGGMALALQAAQVEFDRKPGVFFPNENRVLAHYAELINASPDEVEFVPSTTIGESFIAAGLGLPERGAHVITDAAHYDGCQMMYQEMQKRGLEVTFLPIDKDGRTPLEAYERAIRPGKTKLIALSGTAMITGFTQDVKKLCEIAHAKDVFVYADIIQMAGNAPVDVKDMGVDAACAGTYKWLMSRGTAFLYVNAKSQGKLRPPFYHISNYDFPLPHQTPSTKASWPDTHAYPFDGPGAQIVTNYVPKKGARGMFQQGYMPNLSTLAGLEYSLPYIKSIGVEAIQAHRQPLIARLKDGLARKGYPLITPMDSTSPIVTIAVRDAGRLDPILDKANVKITTRWNHVRVSPSLYNTMDDVERVLAALPMSEA
jgi:selenocysteine lyase/cysteine desulfurase